MIDSLDEWFINRQREMGAWIKKETRPKTTDELLAEMDSILREMKEISVRMQEDVELFEGRVLELARHPIFRKPEHKEES